jgi:hypothetical protein
MAASGNSLVSGINYDSLLGRLLGQHVRSVRSDHSLLAGVSSINPRQVGQPSYRATACRARYIALRCRADAFFLLLQDSWARLTSPWMMSPAPSCVRRPSTVWSI